MSESTTRREPLSDLELYALAAAEERAKPAIAELNRIRSAIATAHGVSATDAFDFAVREGGADIVITTPVATTE